MDLKAGRLLETAETVRAAIANCGTRGVWVGGNAEAARRSLADLKAILRQTLAPE